MSMTTKAKKERKVTVSDKRVQNTAIRLLKDDLVSVELDFVQRQLGNTATQTEIEEKVSEVRQMPWSSLMAGR